MLSPSERMKVGSAVALHFRSVGKVDGPGLDGRIRKMNAYDDADKSAINMCISFYVTASR